MIAETNTHGITEGVIGAATDGHRALGPGLLESAYEACLFYEVTRRGLRVERQKAVRIGYKGLEIDCGYRVDLLVEGQVVVERKTVTRIKRVHVAQVLSYLKLSGCRVGLLINFNVTQLVNGLRRLLNDPPE